MKPQAIVHKMYENDAFSQWLGISVEDVKEGYCRLKMLVREALSIETSINHLEKLVAGDEILAEAKEESLKNTLGIYKVEITKNKKLVALFKGMVYRTQKDWE